MRDRAQIVSVDGDVIKVVPLISDVCINCEKSSCAKRGKSFEVSNVQRDKYYNRPTGEYSEVAYLQGEKAYEAEIGGEAMKKENCEAVMDKFLMKDKNELLPLSVILHVIRCKECRTTIRRMTLAEKNASRSLFEAVSLPCRLFLRRTGS